MVLLASLLCPFLRVARGVEMMQGYLRYAPLPCATLLPRIKTNKANPALFVDDFEAAFAVAIVNEREGSVPALGSLTGSGLGGAGGGGGGGGGGEC